jgi:hypothetical protein
MRFEIADALGETKTMIDEGDASQYKVIDQDAYDDSQKAFMTAAASMAQMPEIKPGVLSPQVISSPAPMGVQAPNPYAPVNYGTMPYQRGGIGRTPSMEEILKALQSRGQ